MEHFYKSIGEDWFDFQDIYTRMVNISTDDSHICRSRRMERYIEVHLI